MTFQNHLLAGFLN